MTKYLEGGEAKFHEGKPPVAAQVAFAGPHGVGNVCACCLQNPKGQARFIEVQVRPGEGGG